MQNLSRIYLNENLETGKSYPLPLDTAHYLTKVMRADKCIVFNKGKEFLAEIRQEQIKKTINYSLFIIHSTNRPDPSNDLTLAFAPIKQPRLEELISMATQMGVAKLQPVITARTTAHHINWERIRKIATESSEQSGRNSVPEIMAPVKFDDFVKNNKNIVFADERFAHEENLSSRRALQSSAGAGSLGFEPQTETMKHSDQSYINKIPYPGAMRPLRDDGFILIGPEGGFSESEFAALDGADATGINLGKTILRAETAAVVAISKLAISS